MNHSLSELETQRNSMYKKLEETGDFRRGTIYLNYRKCGKKNCICAKPGHPGHGPQYLWSTTIKGKSYAKSLKLGPELRKYMDEIDNYHSFLRICNEMVQLNEKICDSRPVPEIEDNSEAEELKKNLKMQFEKKYKKKLSAL
jgi:hypothetical protein